MAFCFSYPPDEISLANAIVSKFPLLKNNVKGCKGCMSVQDNNIQ